MKDKYIPQDHRIKVTDILIPFERVLIEELEYQLQRIKKKWDCFIIFDGAVGSGKSSHALSVCYYMTQMMNEKLKLKNKRTFTPANIVFSPQQFEDAINNLEEINVLMWDEASLGASTSDVMSVMQKTLRKYMDVIRYKRFFVVIVLPEIFDLQKKFVKRAQFLLHHYSPDNMRRGYYNIYDRSRMRQLYHWGKMNQDMYVVGATITNLKFTNHGYQIIKESDYLKKKAAAFEGIGQEFGTDTLTDTERKALQAAQRNQLLLYLHEKVKPRNGSQFIRWLNKFVPTIKWTGSVTKWVEFAKEDAKK